MNATTSANERPQIVCNPMRNGSDAAIEALGLHPVAFPSDGCRLDPMIFARLGADPIPVASLILGRPGHGTSDRGQR